MTRYQPLWLQSGSYAASVDRRLLQALWPVAASNGGAVTATGSGMALQAAPGQVAVPTANGTGSVVCAWDAPETVTLDPAPPSGVNRVDLVVCQVFGNDLDGGVNNEFRIMFVKGADGGAAPAVPANAVALAQVAVPGGAGSIVAGNITDRRPGAMAVPPAAQLVPTGAHARVYRTAAFNITNASTWMAFDVADPDNTPGMVTGLNTANCRIIVPRPGRYLIAGALSGSGTVSSTFYAAPGKNGAGIANGSYPWIQAQAQWGGGPAFAVGESCAAGDAIGMTYQSNNATAQPGQGGRQQTWLAVDYLGPV